MNLLKTSTST